MDTLHEVDGDPLTWLLRLELARQRADANRISVAQAKLAQLGISVVYGRPLAHISRAGRPVGKVVAHAR